MSAMWGRTTVLVRDYADALRFYSDGLGFETVFDSGPETAENPVRFVHIGHAGVATLWLVKAAGAQLHLVGAQTGREPLGVVYVDDLDGALERLAKVGTIPSQPRGSDATSRFAHIPDLYGNDIVIVQML